MQWIVSNIDSLLMIGMAIALVVIWVMNKAGLINKQAAQEIAGGIEESSASIQAALKKVGTEKLYDADGKLDIKAVAEVAQRAVKGTVKQRMGRALAAGRKALAGTISDAAADVDPDPKKRSRPVLRRIKSIIRARLLGG